MFRQRKDLVLYLAKFLGLFLVLFYGTEGVIGLSAPGSHYNRFVAEHLNFIDPFRSFLLNASKTLLSFFDYETEVRDSYTLGFRGGRAIKLVYSCLGYGVLSFWVAFVFANDGSLKKKSAWIIGGCLVLCAINIARISLVLVATNRGWPIPFGWDHHTWFNIVAYGFIFGMVYVYDRSGRRKKNETDYRAEGSAERPKTSTPEAEKNGVPA